MATAKEIRGKSEEFPKDVFLKAPFVLANLHGEYELKKDTVPFEIPPNTYILETSTMDELCLSNIDYPLWQLLQGPYREYFLKLIERNLQRPIKDNDKKYINVIKNLHFYQPGDLIYNRKLSINGGRTGRESDRLMFKNMGFYMFEKEDPEDKFPEGARSKILKSLRTQLIEMELIDRKRKVRSISYEEFIQLVHHEYPETRRGAIFVFSSCADANQADMNLYEFEQKKLQVEQRQREQDLKLYSMLDDPTSFNVPTSDFASMPSVYTTFKSGFHPSAFKRLPKDSMFRLENNTWGKRVLEPTIQRAPVEGEGVFIKHNNSYIQVFHPSGSTVLSDENIKSLRQQYPNAEIYRYVRGAFIPLTGGRRTRKKTRKNRKRTRKTFL